MTEGKELTTQQTDTLIDPMEFFRDRGKLLTARNKEIQEFIADFIPGVDWVALPGVSKPVVNPLTGEYVKDRMGKLVTKPCRMLSKPGSEKATTQYLLRVEQETILDHVERGLIRSGYKGRIYDISGYFSGCGPNTLIAEREAFGSSMEPQWRYRWLRVGPQPQGTRGKTSAEKAAMIRKQLGDTAEPDATYAVKNIEGEWCAAKRIDNDNVLALEHDIKERVQKRVFSALVRIALNISNEFDDDMANPNELGNDDPEPSGIAKTKYANDKPKRGRPPGSKTADKKSASESTTTGAPGPISEQEKIAIIMEELFEAYGIPHDKGWTDLRNMREDITRENVSWNDVKEAKRQLAEATADNGKPKNRTLV